MNIRTLLIWILKVHRSTDNTWRHFNYRYVLSTDNTWHHINYWYASSTDNTRKTADIVFPFVLHAVSPVRGPDAPRHCGRCSQGVYSTPAVRQNSFIALENSLRIYSGVINGPWQTFAGKISQNNKFLEHSSKTIEDNFHVTSVV